MLPCPVLTMSDLLHSILHMDHVNGMISQILKMLAVRCKQWKACFEPYASMGALRL